MNYLLILIRVSVIHSKLSSKFVLHFHVCRICSPTSNNVLLPVFVKIQLILCSFLQDTVEVMGCMHMCILLMMLFLTWYVLQSTRICHKTLYIFQKWAGRTIENLCFISVPLIVVLIMRFFCLTLHRKPSLRRFLLKIMGFLFFALDTQQVQPLFLRYN